RVGEGELGPSIDRSEIDADAGYLTFLVGFAAEDPLPGHGQAFAVHDLEVLADGLMLAAIEHPEADPEPASDPGIGFSEQNRTRVRSPPVADTLWSGQGGEHYRRACLDPTHQGEAGHRDLLRALTSSRSAYSARRSSRRDQKCS